MFYLKGSAIPHKPYKTGFRDETFIVRTDYRRKALGFFGSERFAPIRIFLKMYQAYFFAYREYGFGADDRGLVLRTIFRTAGFALP